MRNFARRVIDPIRSFNRWWIDQLDPQWPKTAAPEVSPDAPIPASPRAVSFRAAGPTSVYSESTPNPNALKFVAPGAILGKAETWNRLEDAGEHPVALALLSLPGVASAFANADFVTVSRADGVAWTDLEPRIIAALQALFPDA